VTALVGCLGGGQLGRMLALSGAQLDVRLRFLDPTADACAGDVGELIVGAFDIGGKSSFTVEGGGVIDLRNTNNKLDGRVRLNTGTGNASITAENLIFEQVDVGHCFKR